ncbi:MAG TPA: methyltransferase domain-containing protein [Geobacterales bacterium]|nr:methyltransferase domain-containing protein [Geobacterales bacterium]
MPDFKKRDTTPELMDTEIVSYEELRGVLRELTQANELSLAYRPTLSFFKRLAREGRLTEDRRIVVIDAASGYGDMSRKVDAWAAKNGVNLEIIGVDMNPWAARASSEATAPGRPLRWVTDNLFDFRPEGGADIIMSSLFTHHLPDPQLVRFIRWMEENARIGWFINDIERHPLPYYFLKVAFWATRRHRFMRHDGPVSIASAFKKEDWVRLLKEAGVPEGAARVESWTPFRLCVSRVKETP